MKIKGSIKSALSLLIIAVLLLLATSCGKSEKLYYASDIANGKSVDGRYSQFENAGVTASGIGYGYDLIDSPYVDGNYVEADTPIIDAKKLTRVAVNLTRDSTRRFDEYSGKSLRELYSEMIGNSESLLGCFARAMPRDFVESDGNTFYYFYMGVYRVNLFSLRITDTIDELRQMLSDEFKSDLNFLSPEALYAKYGTHFINGAAMGGRIEFCVTYSSKVAEYNESTLSAVKAHIDYIGALVSGDPTASYGGECENAGINVQLTVNQVGGPWIDTSSIEACSEMLTSWADSFDETPDYYTHADILDEDSLIGLWLLVDDINVERREELWRFFHAASQDAYGELLDSFNPTTERTLTVITDGNGKVLGNLTYYEKGDTATVVAVPDTNYEFDGWYADGIRISTDAELSFTVTTSVTLTAKFVKGDGLVQLDGSGTKTDPYIITRCEDFAQIAKDASAYYKLAANIDFAAQPPPSLKVPFSGQLDGDNFIISGLLISSVTANDGDVYLGLFSEIAEGGYVHDLHIRSSSIILGNESHESGTLYVGFIAGINRGKIENCTFALTDISVQGDKSCIGTVAGASFGEISGCQLVTVSLYGSGNIGGIAGYLAESATVQSCYVGSAASGGSTIELLSVSANKAAGGIAGVSDGAKIVYTVVKGVTFILSGDTGYLPAMGIVIGIQAKGDLPDLTDTSEYIEIKSSDTSYTQYFFSIGWGICGRCD